MKKGNLVWAIKRIENNQKPANGLHLGPFPFYDAYEAVPALVVGETTTTGGKTSPELLIEGDVRITGYPIFVDQKEAENHAKTMSVDLFTHKKSVMSRYAAKSVNPEYYGTIVVK